jgi:diadenosine tetraphosphate (Ap4A) HIT family hydrolase
MCADGHVPTNPHGELLAELPGSYARLAFNQTHAGYTVLIAKRHAPELHDMNADELGLFWTDVAAAARAVADVCSPVKIDYLVMGHLCPHVHCHVYPQHDADDPHALINIQAGEVRLDEQAWNRRVEALRRRLAIHHPALDPTP